MKNKKIIITILISILLGSVFGSLSANVIGDEKFLQLSNIIDNYTYNSQTLENKSINFNKEIIKNGKTAIILWFLGFISIGLPIIIFILFLKGLCYGFTTTILLRKYNIKGLLYIFGLFFPQSIILIPMFVFLSFFSIKYIIHNPKKIKQDIKLHTVIITTICLCSTLISLMDIYISPLILRTIH